MDRIWSYEEGTYSFDISDASCLSRLSAAFEEAEKGVGDNESLTPAENAEKTCNTVRAFFSALFGDGDSAVICGERQSAARCSDAYLDFIRFLNLQIEQFSRIREAVEERYRERVASLPHAE